MTSIEPNTRRTARAPWPHRRFRPVDGRGARARRLLPRGFLGMLVLVAAVEATLTRAGARFLDPVAWGWAFSARAAREKAAGADVLFLGDSLVKHGLSPRVLKDATGLRAYNLASPASPSPWTYTLFRRALDAGARPSAIVFDLKPSLQVGDPRYTVRDYAQVLTPAEALDLCHSDGYRAIATELALESFLTSYRSRREIREGLMSAFRGETSPLIALNAVCERNWTVNDGVNLATPRPGYAGQVTEPEHEHLISRGFYAHRVNSGYTRRLLTLASARGVRAYLLLPPFVPDLKARRQRTGAEAKYETYVRSLQDRFPGLTVLDARDGDYPPSVFIDPIHLDFRGTLALSAGVSDVLRRDFEPGASPPPPKRWVRLPAYRERPAPAGLEDVELSRARLGLPQPG